MLKLSVIDNGVGIKEQNQSKLFQLFSTFAANGGTINTDGIGLGLVISKMIVEKFSGEIDFFSREGSGTTFHFTFEQDDFDYRQYALEEQKDSAERHLSHFNYLEVEQPAS